MQREMNELHKNARCALIGNRGEKSARRARRERGFRFNFSAGGEKWPDVEENLGH